MSATKRVAVSVLGSMFGGSGADLSLTGRVTAVAEPADEQALALSPAATGVRLLRAPVQLAVNSNAAEGKAVTAKWVAASPPKAAPWISFILVFAAAAALTFAAVYVNALRSGSSIATPQFLRVILPPAGLGLHVEVEGDRLFVNWDRRSPAVRFALNGILRIEDGDQRRELFLDAAQVAAGSILYKPASGDVTFRLDVQNEQGAKTVESVRVLDSLKPPGRNEDVPKPKPNVLSAPVAPIQKRPASPVPETPAHANRTDTRPAARPAPDAAQHDLSDASPVSTTPAELKRATNSFLAFPIHSAQPPAIPSDEVPDGKTVSTTKPARPLRQVMPDLTALGGFVYTSASVKVRVTVDRTGHVKDARVMSGWHESNRAVARAALVAARQWLFEPAALRGRSIESEHLITFEFHAGERDPDSSAFLFKH